MITKKNLIVAIKNKTALNFRRAVLESNIFVTPVKIGVWSKTDVVLFEKDGVTRVVDLRYFLRNSYL